jgi:hypothetical protein
MKRDVIWEWTQGVGLEHCAIETSPKGVQVCAMVVADWEGSTLAVRYRVECDAQWRFMQASIRAARAGKQREVAIERDATGVWRIDGEIASALAGCEDIDLMATPFTNTLPVKRLLLLPGSPQECDVAWVRAPDLSVLRSRQEYARLDNEQGPGAARALPKRRNRFQRRAIARWRRLGDRLSALLEAPRWSCAQVIVCS